MAKPTHAFLLLKRNLPYRNEDMLKKRDFWDFNQKLVFACVSSDQSDTAIYHHICRWEYKEREKSTDRTNSTYQQVRIGAALPKRTETDIKFKCHMSPVDCHMSNVTCHLGKSVGFINLVIVLNFQWTSFTAKSEFQITATEHCFHLKSRLRKTLWPPNMVSVLFLDSQNIVYTEHSSMPA